MESLNGGAEIDDGFPRLLSLASLPAVPRFFWSPSFRGADAGCSILPRSFGSEDEGKVLIAEASRGL